MVIISKQKLRMRSVARYLSSGGARVRATMVKIETTSPFCGLLEKRGGRARSR